MEGLELYVFAVPVVIFFTALNTMAGLGTAFILVPIFYWLGVPLHEASSAGLLLNFVSLIPASISYIHGKLVDFRAAFPIIAGAVVLAPLGGWISGSVNQSILLWLFTAFLIFAGSMMLLYKAKPRVSRRGAGTTVLGGAVGAVAGFIGGLLGVGGGNIILPVLNWLGFDAKVAAATTAFIVIFSSLAGFFGHASLGGLDYVFFGIMALSAIIGALLGSYLMQFKLTSPQLKKVMSVVLFLAAAKIMQGLLSG